MLGEIGLSQDIALWFRDIRGDIQSAFITRSIKRRALVNVKLMFPQEHVVKKLRTDDRAARRHPREADQETIGFLFRRFRFCASDVTVSPPRCYRYMVMGVCGCVHHVSDLNPIHFRTYNQPVW